MPDAVNNNEQLKGTPSGALCPADYCFVFDNIDAFSKAVQAETGQTFEFHSVIEVTTDFLGAIDQYMILNVKDLDAAEANNLLFLTEKKAFVLSPTRYQYQIPKAFEELLDKPFGRSTVLVFLVLSRALDNYTERLQSLNNMTRKLEMEFSYAEYRSLALEFVRLSDRAEEFYDLLLRLQEARYQQVQTSYLSFYYGVLLAESLSLQGRCRRRVAVLADLRRDFDSHATEETNRKIVQLNEVVKRLTSITVILMLPTLIASHFGMNFVYMPELKIPWAYPVVIISQIIFVAGAFLIFKKIKWL